MGKPSEILHEIGDVHSAAYHTSTKRYAFAKLSRVMPGKISPTDVDGRFYVERHKHFLWWEFKTVSPPFGAVADHVPSAQLKPIETLLERGRPRDVAFICLHPRITTVNVDCELYAFALLKWDQPRSDAGGIHVTNWRRPGEMKNWVEHWFKHLTTSPNRFVTNFRRAAGTYPGDVSWEI